MLQDIIKNIVSLHLMRHSILLLLFFGLWARATRADDSEVYADGTSLFPLKNTKVELKKEILSFKYDGKRFAVDVYFEFNNTDKEHTETVGFVTPPSIMGIGENGKAYIKPP